MDQIPNELTVRVAEDSILEGLAQVLLINNMKSKAEQIVLTTIGHLIVGMGLDHDMEFLFYKSILTVSNNVLDKVIPILSQHLHVLNRFTRKHYHFFLKNHYTLFAQQLLLTQPELYHILPPEYRKNVIANIKSHDTLLAYIKVDLDAYLVKAWLENNTIEDYTDLIIVSIACNNIKALQHLLTLFPQNDEKYYQLFAKLVDIKMDNVDFLEHILHYTQLPVYIYIQQLVIKDTLPELSDTLRKMLPSTLPYHLCSIVPEINKSLLPFVEDIIPFTYDSLTICSQVGVGWTKIYPQLWSPKFLSSLKGHPMYNDFKTMVQKIDAQVVEHVLPKDTICPIRQSEILPNELYHMCLNDHPVTYSNFYASGISDCPQCRQDMKETIYINL